MALLDAISTPPLSLDEQLELTELLEESESRSLVFARGVFTAAATTPLDLEPTDWLTLILGEQVPNKDLLKRLMSLLMRDCQHLSAQLASGVDPTPESEDEDVVREFCRGYMQLAQKDGAWTSSQQAFDLTLPVMVLSEYVSLESLRTLKPSAVSAPEEYRRTCIEDLGSSVGALYAHFRNARSEAVQQRASRAQEKVGRNDPCPCGSGKKFKKCCA